MSATVTVAQRQALLLVSVAEKMRNEIREPFTAEEQRVSTAHRKITVRTWTQLYKRGYLSHVGASMKLTPAAREYLRRDP